MADPTKVAMGLADLAVKVQEKADQAESNQATCKILAGHIRAVVPVIKLLEDKVCEEDERLQDFVDDMGSLLVETDKLIDKIKSRNKAKRLLKASKDERGLTTIKDRLAQMSQRATFQILAIVTEIKSMVSGEGAKPKRKKACRPIELKALSTQNVDLSDDPDWVLVKTTGEIVFVCRRKKEDDTYLSLYTLRQGGPLDEKMIKLPCDYPGFYGHIFLNWLFIKILWRKYLAISCMQCKDIKLVDLETLEITTAYNAEQLVGKMYQGWHKLFVEVPSGFLELDCSSTKFTKIRDIESGKRGINFPGDICYIPPPYNMFVAINKFHGNNLTVSVIHATYLDEPSKTIWHLSAEEVDGKRITPRRVLYSSRHYALLVLDVKNKKIWVLDPGTGEVVQNIDVPQLDQNDYDVEVFLGGSQLIIAPAFKVHYFSIA